MKEMHEIEADSDSEALALMGLRGEKSDCELWCGDRLVARVPRGSNPSSAELLR